MGHTLNDETAAWLRARDAGLELPPDVQAAAERLEGIEAELASLPTVDVKTPSELAAQGVPLDKAQSEAAKAAQKAAAAETARRSGIDARDVARLGLNRAVTTHREELVLAARPLVDALIEKARPFAEALAPFAPAYAPGDIVRRGDAAALEAWQAAQEIEREFGLLISAWRASTRAAGKANQPDAIDHREIPQASLYWARPELVASEALTGKKLNRRGRPVAIAPDVLNVAAESPEAGFRLASSQEIRAAFKAAHPEAGKTHRTGTHRAVAY
jgi:hypothetical protein